MTLLDYKEDGIETVESAPLSALIADEPATRTTTIELDGTYFIDPTDRFNWTLRERGMTDPKPGEEAKPIERTHAYCGSFAQALGKYSDSKLRDARPTSLDDVLTELRSIRETIAKVAR